MKLVTIERSVKNETLGIKKKVPFEVPQAETFDEGVNFCGGQPAALAILNQYFSNRAPSSALVALGNSKTQAEFDADTIKYQKNVREWNPEISTGPSKAAVFEGYSNLTEFRTKYPDIWNKLTLDEGLAVINKDKTLETVLAEKGITLPAAA